MNVGNQFRFVLPLLYRHGICRGCAAPIVLRPNEAIPRTLEMVAIRTHVSTLGSCCQGLPGNDGKEPRPTLARAPLPRVTLRVGKSLMRLFRIRPYIAQSSLSNIGKLWDVTESGDPTHLLCSERHDIGKSSDLFEIAGSATWIWTHPIVQPCLFRVLSSVSELITWLRR